MGEIDSETRLVAMLVFVAVVAVLAIVVIALLASLWRRHLLREQLRDAERAREAARAAGHQDTWAAAAQRLKPAEPDGDKEDDSP